MSKRKREVEAPGPVTTNGHKRTKTSGKKHKIAQTVNGGHSSVVSRQDQLRGHTQSKEEKAARKAAGKDLWIQKQAEIAATGNREGTAKHHGRPKYSTKDWSASNAAVGRMLEVDPILSKDEQYVRRCLHLCTPILTSVALLDISLSLTYLPLWYIRPLHLSSYGYCKHVKRPRLWHLCFHQLMSPNCIYVQRTGL